MRDHENRPPHILQVPLTNTRHKLQCSPWVKRVQPDRAKQTISRFTNWEKCRRSSLQKTPVYPLAARTAGVETRVVVEVYISDQGKVDDVKLIKSGGAGFDQAVIEAVRGSSFEPGMQTEKR